jgi:hypothetical protein
MENDHLITLLDRTARMEEKLDSLLDSRDKHDERIGKVEKHMYMGYGVVAVMTFIISTFAEFFWSKIFGKNS